MFTLRLVQLLSPIVYDIVIRLYWLSIFIAAPFNKKARLWVRGRKNPASFLPPKDASESKKNKRIWFHCASLGEFEQARPVIEKIKTFHPEHKVIVSFFSPSGYEIRKNYEYADVVFYLPMDTKANAQKIIAQIQPDVVLFVKYEFWFHYLYELRAARIPTILFSSVFRKEQIFFEWYGIFFVEMLQLFTKVFVQNIESKKLLDLIGVDCEMAYDTRFDRVYDAAEKRRILPLVAKFKGNLKIFIAGSTWKKDEKLLVHLINDNTSENHKYIIAPHDIDMKRIRELKKSIQSPCVLLSELTETNAESAQVIVVDSVGLLVSLYAYGNIAYVGGGFNAGVHNILEPVVYGMPVIFGPKYQKSVEAAKLIAIAVAFSISGYKDLLARLRVIMERSRQPANNDAKLSQKYIIDRLGGAERVYTYISRRL